MRSDPGRLNLGLWPSSSFAADAIVVALSRCAAQVRATSTALAASDELVRQAASHSNVVFSATHINALGLSPGARSDSP